MIKLLKFIRPYYMNIFLIIFLIFGQVMSDLSLPTLMSEIVDIGIVKNDIGVIWRTGFLMIVLAFAAVLLNVSAGFLAAKTSVAFGTDIRSEIFSRVTGFSLDEIDRFGTSSLITRTTNDVTQVQNAVFMIMRMMLMAPIMAVGGIIMAIHKEPQLAWILILVVPVIAFFISFLTAKGFPLFSKVQKKIDRINLVLRENLIGIRVIRAFDRTDYERRRFDASNNDLMNATLKVNRIIALLFPFVMLVMTLTPVLIVWVSGPLLESHSIQFGSLMAFIQYSTQIMFSIVMITMVFIMIPRAQASAARINEIIQSSSSVSETSGGMLRPVIHGHVEFKNVFFSYSGAESPALENISFTAEPGQVTAIIGGTGSGKSTLVNLIPGFYKPEKGCVLIDGTDVSDMDIEHLRAHIGSVPQQSVLFSGTIAENIRFGNENATGREIRHSAETAQAAGFISEMENAFAEMIVQGGKNVSGGQRQRITIARALVRKPSIYIFDDSFSALDFKTDFRLRQALKKETSASTVIIVAQRVNTIIDADKIIVMDDGKIVGTGNHLKLLLECPVYREIVSSQNVQEAM